MTSKSVPEAETEFVPFANDAAVANLGSLSFENGSARIAIHGSLDITRDRAGLQRATALKALVDAIVTALSEADLPDEVAEETRGTTRVKNPFA